MSATHLDYKEDIEEGFSYVVKDIALKSLLFAMVFYIINSKLINKFLSFTDRYSFIEKNFIQSIIFGLVFYLISINL